VDIILWRHAYARRIDEGAPVDEALDLARELTPKGHVQARASAKWLKRHLSAGTRVLCSPALRCQETAQYLEMEVRTVQALRPSAGADEVLAAAKWPSAKSPVLIVGHQPALGQVVGRLLGIAEGVVAVRKAGIWWLRQRERDGVTQTTVVAVVSPDMAL
jgi:phosphohistidine phosphatase